MIPLDFVDGATPQSFTLTDKRVHSVLALTHMEKLIHHGFVMYAIARTAARITRVISLILAIQHASSSLTDNQVSLNKSVNLDVKFQMVCTNVIMQHLHATNVTSSTARPIRIVQILTVKLIRPSLVPTFVTVACPMVVVLLDLAMLPAPFLLLECGVVLKYLTTLHVVNGILRLTQRVL